MVLWVVSFLNYSPMGAEHLEGTSTYIIIETSPQKRRLRWSASASHLPVMARWGSCFSRTVLSACNSRIPGPL